MHHIEELGHLQPHEIGRVFGAEYHKCKDKTSSISNGPRLPSRLL